MDWRGITAGITAGMGNTLREARDGWRIPAAIVGACLLAAVAVSLAMPRTYRATGTVEIDAGRQADADGDATPLDEFARRQNLLQTYTELLQTRTLAAEVARSLDLAGNAGFRAEHELAAEKPGTDDVVNALLGGLSVEQVGNTTLVEVGFDSREPQLAMRVANRWIESFIASRRARLGAGLEQEQDNLQRRIGELRSELEKAEQDLLAYAAENGLLVDESEDAADDGETLGQRLVLDDLEQANAELSAAITARIAAESARAAGSAAAGSRSGTDVAALRRRRTQLETQVAQLSSRFGDAYPPLAGMRQEIAGIEARLEDAESASSEGLEADVRAAQAREQMLRERVSQLREDVAGQREDLLQYNILKRATEERRALYEGLVARYGELALGALGPDPVALVEPATVPNRPVSPDWLLNLAIGLGAGLALALIAIVLARLRGSVPRGLERGNRQW